MTKKILAVSGGVDSMVMLDMIYCSRKYASGDIIVAHFDHGIRTNSKLDAEFAQRKAEEYGLEFRLGKAELGAKASEAVARMARYNFLDNIDPFATVFTAHHLDDLIETVAINFVRGTGWRGLSGLDRAGVYRPFLESNALYEPMDKTTIMEYAAKRNLEFREDQTNSSDEYLRNRIRHQMNNLPLSFEQKLQIYELWKKQKNLKNEIDQVIAELLPEKGGTWEREWFKELDKNELGKKVALELLRAGTVRVGISATRPQLEDFRQAILNYGSGKMFNLPNDNLIKFTKTSFKL